MQSAQCGQSGSFCHSRHRLLAGGASGDRLGVGRLPGLVRRALAAEEGEQNPNGVVRVIIQASSATAAQAAVVATGGSLDGDKLGRRLGAVRGVRAG
jgi:hypothetical protein